MWLRSILGRHRVGQLDHGGERPRHRRAQRGWKAPATAFVALGLLATFSGCGTSNDAEPDSGGNGRGELSEEQRAELEEFCEWWGRMNCELAHEMQPLRVDAEHCADTEARACKGSFIPKVGLSIAEGRVVYHPEVREQILEDIRLMPFYSYSERELLPSWRALFQGTVPNGEPCYQADSLGPRVYECENGYCEWGECPGTCKPFLEAGDQCAGDDPPCTPTTYCDGRCVKRPAEGEACDPDGIHCLPPARCLGEGRCGEAAALGEACSRTTDCLEGACHDGRCELSGVDEPCVSAAECEAELSCIDEVCAPRGTLSSSSYSCWVDRDCVEGEICWHVEFGANCWEPPRLGSGCTTCPHCLGCPHGLVCEGADANGTVIGTCALPGELGDACGFETCAGEYACNANGVCAERPNSLECDPTP